MWLSESHPDMCECVSCDDIIKIIFTWYLYSSFFLPFSGVCGPLYFFKVGHGLWISCEGNKNHVSAWVTWALRFLHIHTQPQRFLNLITELLPSQDLLCQNVCCPLQCD